MAHTQPLQGLGLSFEAARRSAETTRQSAEAVLKSAEATLQRVRAAEQAYSRGHPTLPTSVQSNTSPACQSPPAPQEDFWKCPICLSPLTVADQATIATCGHMFHNKSACLRRLLARGSALCPVCRDPILNTIPVYNGIPSRRSVVRGFDASVDDTTTEKSASVDCVVAEENSHVNDSTTDTSTSETDSSMAETIVRATGRFRRNVANSISLAHERLHIPRGGNRRSRRDPRSRVGLDNRCRSGTIHRRGQCTCHARRNCSPRRRNSPPRRRNSTPGQRSRRHADTPPRRGHRNRSFDRRHRRDGFSARMLLFRAFD